MACKPYAAPMPPCACGCGRSVLRRHRRYLRECVPRELRASGGSKGRRNFAYRRRALRYRTELQALMLRGTTLSTESLLELCERIWRRAYMTGYHACEDKHGRRAPRSEVA